MTLIKNRLIAAFIAFSLVFASLWAMSPEALADTFKEETSAFHQELQHAHQNQNTSDQSTQDQQCNHGCHMVCHLLGFAESCSKSIFEFNESSVVFPYTDDLSESPFLQGLYRPPLTLSLI